MTDRTELPSLVSSFFLKTLQQISTYIFWNEKPRKYDSDEAYCSLYHFSLN
jgi:hypothetical protein